jgi:hypothetical protein
MTAITVSARCHIIAIVIGVRFMITAGMGYVIVTVTMRVSMRRGMIHMLIKRR